MDSALTNAPRERLIELAGRGGAMAGLECGDLSRPVDIVFVHANGFNARTYSSILSPLSGEFLILAVDQRGHGRSTLPADTAGRTSVRAAAYSATGRGMAPRVSRTIHPAPANATAASSANAHGMP